MAYRSKGEVTLAELRQSILDSVGLRTKSVTEIHRERCHRLNIPEASLSMTVYQLQSLADGGFLDESYDELGLRYRLNYSYAVRRFFHVASPRPFVERSNRGKE